MLELNANCGIYYPEADWGSADICLSLDPAGHEGFTRQLVAAALARHARLSPESYDPMEKGPPTVGSETPDFE
jgi:hypothetical protein